MIKRAMAIVPFCVLTLAAAPAAAAAGQQQDFFEEIDWDSLEPLEVESQMDPWEFADPEYADMMIGNWLAGYVASLATAGFPSSSGTVIQVNYGSDGAQYFALHNDAQGLQAIAISPIFLRA